MHSDYFCQCNLGRKVFPAGCKCFAPLDSLNSPGLMQELEVKSLHVSWAAKAQRLQHLHRRAPRELPARPGLCRHRHPATFLAECPPSQEKYGNVGCFSEKTPVSQHCGLTWKSRNAFFWVMLLPLFCSERNILFLFQGNIFLAMIQYLNVLFFFAKVHFDTEHHLKRRGW